MAEVKKGVADNTEKYIAMHVAQGKKTGKNKKQLIEKGKGYEITLSKSHEIPAETPADNAGGN